MRNERDIEEEKSEKQNLFGPLGARQIAHTLLYRKKTAGIILEELLLWPPDLFAFTSVIFSLTGAYHLVISPPHHNTSASWPPQEENGEKWTDKVKRLGYAWRTTLSGFRYKNGKYEMGRFSETELKDCKDIEGLLNQEQRKKKIHSLVGHPDKRGRWREGTWVPLEISKIFAELCKHMPVLDEGNIDDLFDDWEALKALVTLHAIVDEAAVGWGIREIPFKGKNGGPFLLDRDCETMPTSQAGSFAASQLEQFGTMSTFNPFRGRVLPKRHTAEVGITLRSMSSNLAFHRSSVNVLWRVADEDNILTDRLHPREPNRIFSVLLLPWPLKVSAQDFKFIDRPGRLGMDNRYGLFSYSPPKWFEETMLTTALRAAKEEVGEIDIVVLPECALNENEIKSFEWALGDEEFKVSAYVAGVRGLGLEPNDQMFTDNMVYFKMGNTKRGEDKRTEYFSIKSSNRPKEDNIQYKHHRWKVDRTQIQNYSLGHALSPNKIWWESIKIRRRKVTFINIGNELTLCPLICEDLSRQDPIADLIRSVGPSLVITILMDGPQKKDRWSARYASVLSEDPGCAVITLSSAGMVDRWRHPIAKQSRAVALWNDGQGGEREIELEKGAVGILLSLSISPTPEVSADGREESYSTNRITLGGVHQVYPPKERPLFPDSSIHF